MNVFEEYFSSGFVHFSKLHEFLQLWRLVLWSKPQYAEHSNEMSEILNVYMIFFHLHPSILRDFGPLCEMKN